MPFKQIKVLAKQLRVQSLQINEELLDPPPSSLWTSGNNGIDLKPVAGGEDYTLQ
jgi:hypothetical protein